MVEQRQITLILRLDRSVPGTVGGVQYGQGSAGNVREWQRMDGGEASFCVDVDATYPLKGTAIQKDSKGRFVYIVWRDDTGLVNRRAKVYVESVTKEMLETGGPLEVLLPGIAKDGWPCCATLKPLVDWRASGT